MKNKNIRPAAVAGKFYSASSDVLEKEVVRLIAENRSENEGKVFALMSPHAGYAYAGPAYGAAYSVLEKRKIKTVIIIGNSHHAYFDGISVYAKGGYETPLGKIYVDEAVAGEIMEKDKKIYSDEKIHINEHSIETQLPFLQKVLPDAKIVPIIMGNDLMGTCNLLALAIEDAARGRDDVVIIASSDMSHYPPYDAANRVDKEVLDMIKKGNALELEKLLAELEMRGVPSGVSFLCGAGAVKTAMILARRAGAGKIDILKYLNSGDTIEKDGVVGYGAVAFSFGEDIFHGRRQLARLRSQELATKINEKGGEDIINEIEKDNSAAAMSTNGKKELVKIAKDAVEAKVRGQNLPEIKTDSVFLLEKRGAFVTLKKGGALRGCIGRFITNDPLYKVVQEMAVEAALSDPRFVAVTEDELWDLEYEVSVLSPLEKISDPFHDIVLGVHGVQVRQGFHSGVFLPQVAHETGWNFEEFMNNLCEQKAGISRDAWKRGDAEIYRFTAEIVSE
ncbi:hypothetical protein A2Y83_00095 [Candidatus Falkowbacteria bacterium RBG_13_39_14]|uniref:MEMO1 family protein A2Y83_00095 n=1 Tax=Candidatus Falkowbacteria bacterium RBG_13_39_14 TaxID=1797985 RepID=A0A1F5S759_9BACT|nr:MAG: hypothetical protein A2Y83_00095 [Candidatus Falkowbacteria bacterium RBG_13_39_14]